MQHQDDNYQSVWYKEPWCLFILGILLVTFISGFFFVRIAFNQPHQLVKDDYYKEGKAINRQIDKLILAKQLDLKAELFVERQNLRLNFSGNIPELPRKLGISFIHPTISEKDFELIMLATDVEKGIYQAQLPITIENKWYLDLYPENQAWKMKGELQGAKHLALSFTSR